jgi:hypothetical protein
MKRILAPRAAVLAVAVAALTFISVAAAEAAEEVELIGGEACVEFVRTVVTGGCEPEFGTQGSLSGSGASRYQPNERVFRSGR